MVDHWKHYPHSTDWSLHKRQRQYISDDLKKIIRKEIPRFQKNYCSYELCRENATYLSYRLAKIGIDNDIIKGKLYIEPFWKEYEEWAKVRSISIDHEWVELYKNEQHGIKWYSIIDTCSFQAVDAVAKIIGKKNAEKELQIDDYTLVQNRNKYLRYEKYWYVEAEELEFRLSTPIGEFWDKKLLARIMTEFRLKNR